MKYNKAKHIALSDGSVLIFKYNGDASKYDSYVLWTLYTKDGKEVSEVVPQRRFKTCFRVNMTESYYPVYVSDAVKLWGIAGFIKGTRKLFFPTGETEKIIRYEIVKFAICGFHEWKKAEETTV